MAEIIVPQKPGGYEFQYANGWFEVATVNYVLSILRQIIPCEVATTDNLIATYTNGTIGVGANLTNSGIQSALVIDGITLAVGNRVLVKDQTTGLQNGIYVVTDIGSVTENWVLTRSDDYDVISRIKKGDIVPVIKGTTNKASLWMLTSDISFIGVSNFDFLGVDRNSFTAINGTTNEINVDVAGGVATIGLADNPIIPGNESITIPIGTTADRPLIPKTGMIRFNMEL
jgi:hypothetical protein